jgi:hypothetical protein
VKPRTAVHVAFFAGCWGNAAVRSLHQDYLGLEGYIALCRSTWLDARITVPLALVISLASLVGYTLALPDKR